MGWFSRDEFPYNFRSVLKWRRWSRLSEGGLASLDAHPSPQHVRMNHRHWWCAQMSCRGRPFCIAKIPITPCSQDQVEGEVQAAAFLALDELWQDWERWGFLGSDISFSCYIAAIKKVASVFLSSLRIRTSNSRNEGLHVMPNLAAYLVKVAMRCPEQ